MRGRRWSEVDNKSWVGANIISISLWKSSNWKPIALIVMSMESGSISILTSMSLKLWQHQLHTVWRVYNEKCIGRVCVCIHKQMKIVSGVHVYSPVWLKLTIYPLLFCSILLFRRQQRKNVLFRASCETRTHFSDPSRSPVITELMAFANSPRSLKRSPAVTCPDYWAITTF